MSNSSRGQAWRRSTRDRILAKRRDRLLLHGSWMEPTPQIGRFSKVKGQIDRGRHFIDKPEKDWKQIYTRSAKLSRAKQLKLFYPRKAWALELSEIL